MRSGLVVMLVLATAATAAAEPPGTARRVGWQDMPLCITTAALRRDRVEAGAAVGAGLGSLTRGARSEYELVYWPDEYVGIAASYRGRTGEMRGEELSRAVDRPVAVAPGWSASAGVRAIPALGKLTGGGRIYPVELRVGADLGVGRVEPAITTADGPVAAAAMREPQPRYRPVATLGIGARGFVTDALTVGFGVRLSLAPPASTPPGAIDAGSTAEVSALVTVSALLPDSAYLRCRCRQSSGNKRSALEGQPVIRW